MRPLYYRVEPRRALFATEIKQLVALPDVPVRLYEPAVSAHLAGLFGPLSWTCYAGIIQLEPAHVLVIDASGHRTWRYWDIDPDAEIRYPREADYAEHFMELFQESVRCRLRSVKHPDCLHTFYEALCAGEKNDFRIWNTLTLEMWLRQYWS